jgi:hypothetical protein
MHKITNFAGGVRHGWEIPFGGNRSQPQQGPPQHDMHMNGPFKRPGAQPAGVNVPGFMGFTAPGMPISHCFKVPFNNTLAGPEAQHVIYSSPGALERWSHPPGTPEDTPIHRLPVHLQHVEELRARCTRLKTETGVEAAVTVGRAKNMSPLLGIQIAPSSNVVANVCLHGGDGEAVKKAREIILNQSPITLVCSCPMFSCSMCFELFANALQQSATIPIDRHMVFVGEQHVLNENYLNELNRIADTTKADIFLLDPEDKDDESSLKLTTKEPLQMVVYGDMLTKEHAKLRILILVDQMVCQSISIL